MLWIYRLDGQVCLIFVVTEPKVERLITNKIVDLTKFNTDLILLIILWFKRGLTTPKLRQT